MVALREVDLKRIVAHSSICHLNMVAVSLWYYSAISPAGVMALLISHGLCSGALFFLVGSLYERHRSRLIFMYGGLTQVIPRFSAIFVVLLLVNCGLPGSSGFIGELILFVNSCSLRPALGAFLVFGNILLSCVLSL